MDHNNLLVFAALALLAIATPGPTVLLALHNGARHGVRVALPGVAGAVLSDFVLTGAVALGLGALLAASELAFALLKWLGVAYLAWLGLRLLRSRGTLAGPGAASAGTTPPPPWAVFRRSFLVAVGNPKGYLFFTALLPQFIDPAAPAAAQYTKLALVFAAIDAAVMLAYALAGAQAMHLLREHGALWLDRLCGGALLALAGSLALVRRGG
jgi:threonine/homoserine/homoserine lactone efflux protein